VRQNARLIPRLPYGCRFLAPFPHQRQEAVGQDEGSKHRGYVEAVLYVQEPLHIVSAVLVQVAWGHQEISNQPMERYINQALSFESAETLRTTGSPKRRNETPNPKVKAAAT
jgi:hypothetical protein